MHRILVGECKQEVSSFNPVPIRFEDFRVVRGAALLEHHRRVREELGGALSVFDADRRIEVLPAWGASSNTSGGILAADSFQRLSDTFLGAIADATKTRGIEGAYFSLHGAMQAEQEVDPEGYLLEEARRLPPRRGFPARTEASSRRSRCSARRPPTRTPCVRPASRAPWRSRSRCCVTAASAG